MSFCDRLAAHFRSLPNSWRPWHELAAIAGAMAWRTRVSDCRKPPYNMDIQCRVRQRADGVKVSEYKYVPPVESLLDLIDAGEKHGAPGF